MFEWRNDKYFRAKKFIFGWLNLTCLVCLIASKCWCNPIDAKSQWLDSEKRYNSMRENMVKTQIENRGIQDVRVLDAIRKVPRHKFVPLGLQDRAYEDRALPIGEGQTISQPYVVAIMSELLKVKKGGRVLEIGTGSGYQAAVLAELDTKVYTIEIIKLLADKAEVTLKKLGYCNISFRCGDGYQGWPEASPFDAIIVTAAPDHLPESLVDQLRVGGRMVIPVGRGDQDLLLLVKEKDGVRKEKVIPVRFVPMTGAAQQK